MSSPIRATLVAIAMSSGAWAADEVVRHADLRAMVDVLPGYEITESKSVDADWKGLPTDATQVGVERLWLGERQDWGGAVYGLRFNIAVQTAMPSGYSTNGVIVANTTDEELRWQRVGFGLVGGWQSGPVAIDDIRLFGELTGFIEANVLHASLNSTVESASSYGKGAEMGIRAALMLAESDWYGGIAVTALAGRSKVELSTQNADRALELSRNGLGVGLVVGRRF